MPAILEQYRIADFLEWYREEKLFLNPDFQRGSVWTPSARIYLIDTILREFPIPKIYIRTTVHIPTKKSIREVVDGQQRLRAIIDFADDKIKLTRRAGEFEGLTYSTLSQDFQEIFLSYPIAVGQLLNASDDDVLETFARLNSYSVSLNAAEKRHAKFTGEFKWSVRQASRRWKVLWDTYKIITVRNRVRMLDDSLMAEMYGMLLNGVTDGGQPKIDKIYERYDRNFDSDGIIPGRINDVLGYFVKELAEDLTNTPLLNAPHFLMLFAALAHARGGIPKGELGLNYPEPDNAALSNMEIAKSNLLQLASVVDSDDVVPQFEEFWKRSRSSTQRIASRKVRFPVYYRALLPIPL